MSDPGLHDQHVDAAGGVRLGQLAQVRGVRRVGLETDGTNLLQVSILGFAEIFFIQRQNWSQRKGVWLVQFSDLQTSVGAQIHEYVQTSIKRILSFSFQIICLI